MLGGVCPHGTLQDASAPGARLPGGATARPQGTPSAAASLMAVGAGADAGALPAAQDATDAAADATGALTGVDALAAAVGPAAMAAGAVAAMAVGLGMLAGANDTLLRFTAPPPASHLHSVAALDAVRAAAAEGMARVREAAIAWERERDAADALACQVAEAAQILGIPASPDVGATSSAGPHVAHTSAAGPRVAHTVVLWHDPADPLVTQLHYQAGGVQNIRLLVPVVLEPESPSYARWRDLVLLTLRRYALDDHVLLDTAGAVPTPSWLRLDSVVLSWILGTISLDLHDLVRNTPSARGAWLALERQFLGNTEARALRLDASFYTFV